MIPEIALSLRAAKIMKMAVHHQNAEVQGFGKCEYDKKQNLLWVTDIYIPPQYVGTAHVDTPPELLEQVMTELGQRGEVLGQYPLWWHSHPGGGSTSPSGQDDTTIKALADEFEGFMFGIVTNKAEYYHGFYAVSMDTEYGRITTQGRTNVRLEMEAEDEALKAEVEKMMERVTEPPKPDPKAGGKELNTIGGLPSPLSWLDDDAHWHDKHLKGGAFSRKWCNVKNCKEGGRVELHSRTGQATTGKAEAGSDEGMGLLSKEEADYYLSMQELFDPATQQRNMTLYEFVEWFEASIDQATTEPDQEEQQYLYGIAGYDPEGK